MSAMSTRVVRRSEKEILGLLKQLVLCPWGKRMALQRKLKVKAATYAGWRRRYKRQVKAILLTRPKRAKGKLAKAA